MEPPRIDTIDLGLGEKRVSKMALGTVSLHSNKDCSLILNTAVEYGVTTFDLAPSYLTHDRVKEWLISLRQNDPDTFRRLVFIIKGGFPEETKPGQYVSKLGGKSWKIAENLQEELEKALAFYELPKADLFVLHRDDEDYLCNKIILRPKTPVKNIFEALQNPVVRPLYTDFGVSNWEDSRVLELQTFRKLSGKSSDKLCVSPYFSLWERGAPAWTGEYQTLHSSFAEAKYLPGCVNLTYAPLGGWFGSQICITSFDTAHKSAYAEGGDDRASIDAIFTPENRKRYERLRELTERLNRERCTSYTLAQIALAYSFAHPRVDGCFLAVQSVEELESDIQGYMLAKSLTKDDLSYLHDVV